MRRLSQSELAFRVGISQSYLSQLESDNSSRTKSPRLVLLIKLSQELNICANDLLRFKCDSCFKFTTCTRHNQLEDDDTYFKQHLDYYI